MGGSKATRKSRSIIGLLSCCLFVTPDALGAEETPEPPVSGAGVPVDDATIAQKSAAQEAFAVGDRAFDTQDYTSALKHFRKSLSIVNSPNSRLMVARSLLELDRLEEAYHEYERVLQHARNDPTYEQTHKTAQRERDALKSRLAWLTIDTGELPEEAVITVNGREISQSEQQGAIPLDPGKSVVHASTAEGKTATVEVHMAAGRQRTVTLEIGEKTVVGLRTPSAPHDGNGEELRSSTQTPNAQKPSSSRPLRPWAYVAGGVGLVGTGGFVTFGVLSERNYNRLLDSCNNGVCPQDSQSDIDRGKRYQLLANIGLGVGVVGVATGTLLFILEIDQDEAPIQLHANANGLRLRGRF